MAIAPRLCASEPTVNSAAAPATPSDTRAPSGPRARNCLIPKTAGSTAYPQWGLSWSYDVYGNRLSQNVTAGSAPSNFVSVSATTNHIITAGYAYDAAGNMTNDGANTVTYDDESKITAVSGSYGSGSYQYDGSGMRVEKTVSGATTVYVFSGGSVIAEYASGGSPSSPQKEYVYAGGSLPIAEIDSGSTVKYYEADTLSVRQVTNSSGTVLEDQGQYPYGESWYQSSTQTKFQFTNYLHDSESDNEYAHAREYVNRLARFETLDPADGSVSDPLSWNRYTYVLDDPVNLADPMGLQPQPPPAPGGINPGGLNTCTLNGVYVSCGFAQQEYTQGSAGKCLNGGCTTWETVGGYKYEVGHWAGSQAVWRTGPGSFWGRFSAHWVPTGLVGRGPDYGLPQPSAEDLRVQALANAVVAKAGYLTHWQFWAEWTAVTAGPAATEAVAADLAAGPEESALFGRFSPINGGFKGYLNSPGWLRIGYGWNGEIGQTVSRIGGSVLGWLMDNPHIDLWPPSAWPWWPW